MFDTEATSIAVHDFADAGVVDPFQFDAPGESDRVVADRALARIVLVACETGARFERAGMGDAPADWMHAPLDLFGGEPAVRACADRTHFLRAMALHWLELGVDETPTHLDAVMAARPGGTGDSGGADGVFGCAPAQTSAIASCGSVRGVIGARA